MLERTDAVSDFIIATPQAERALREEFRCVIFRQRATKTLNIYQVYPGVSTMTAFECGELIDIAQQMACELGVDDGTLHNA